MADINDADESLEQGDEIDSEDQKILEQAHDRLELAMEAESEIRRLALEDLEFRAGKQWHDKDQSDRAQDGRPCIVINRMPQIVQQIANDQRQNRPAIKVHPVDDLADVQTAKIIQGLIRHIEYDSGADVAYDTAFEGAVGNSFGFFRILTEFTDPMSFDQDIKIKQIENPFSTYLDPHSKEPDGSDSEYGFVIEDLSPEEYRSKYPDSKLSGDSDWSSIGNSKPSWMREGSVRVAEYFYRVYEDRTIHLLNSGEVVEDKDLESHMAAHAVLNAQTAQMAQAAGQPSQAVASPPIAVVRSRQTKVPVVKWTKINAIEVLDKTDWPGKYIPIIPVYGSKLVIDGKRVLESVIRHAKDPQRMYNYWKSAETEAIALAPRAPFIGAEGQFEGHEEKWATANRRNHPFLEYKPTSIGGVMSPPPARQSFEPAIQAVSQAAMMAADDIKATTGLFDAGQGSAGPEVSGVAIQRRNTQIQTTNFHFVDNLTRSLRHAGRILVDMLPKVYDTDRTARIIKEDGEQQVVKINQDTGEMGPDGKPLIYDLSSGKYDVTVDVGPSYASKRQEAVASMLSVTQSMPEVMHGVADLVVKNMDWPGAQEIADRLKKMLPPQFQDDGKNGPQIPPQAQAQIAQMHQMIESLSQNLNEATKVIETKKLDLEHRERVEIMKLQVEAEIAMAKMGSTESIALLKHEVQTISERMKLIGMNQPIDAPQDFNPQGADGGNYAGIGHIGGSENLTGEESPGTSMEGT